MSDIFKDILPSIMENKKDIEPSDKDYVPFVINRALSYQSDCLFDANTMNCLSGLDKRLQYLFYLNSIRAARRPFAKWAKPVKKLDLQAVKMYFGYGDREAILALNVLTEDQLVTIRTRTNIGE